MTREIFEKWVMAGEPYASVAMTIFYHYKWRFLCHRFTKSSRSATLTSVGS